MDTMNSILAAVRERPALWLKPEFASLRSSFVTEVSQSPQIFEPGLATLLLVASDQNNQPTKGFVPGVYSRENKENNGTPVVVVRNVGHKKRRHGDAFVRHYVLHCVDGDDDVLTVCINTALNNRMGYLESGSILKLIRFTPLYYNNASGKSSPSNVAVLVSNFNLLGKTTIAAIHREPPISRLQVAAAAADENDAPSVHNENTTGVQPRSKPVPTSNAEKEKLLPCSGKHCSKYGIYFAGTCVTKCFEVGKMNLSAIADGCYFANKETTDMSQSEKRNLCYYWFATNVYSLGGTVAKKLPNCIEHAVRNEYPNPPGEPYTEYKERKDRKQY